MSSSLQDWEDFAPAGEGVRTASQAPKPQNWQTGLEVDVREGRGGGGGFGLLSTKLALPSLSFLEQPSVALQRLLLLGREEMEVGEHGRFHLGTCLGAISGNSGLGV